MKSKPLVSVNIRTFNSSKTLTETLQSVKDQTYQNIEIVISDGYSIDGSIEIAKKFKARIDFSDNLGDARYQNYQNSRGKYVVSLDSDQLMDKKLIKICVSICENDGLDVLIISEKSLIKKDSSLLEKILVYDKWVIDQNRDADVVFGTACPRFFRKDLLKDVKWPKKLGIFDDTILYSQLKKRGAKIKYIDNVSIRHSEMSSWWGFIKKFHRYGKSYPVAFSQSPITIAGHSLPRRSYFGRIALSKPHYFFGLIILYTVKLMAASTGILSYYLQRMMDKK